MSKELKPCSSCTVIPDGPVHYKRSGTGHNIYSISCCYTDIESDTPEEAINQWNNRPIEDALNAELVNKEEELEALRGELAVVRSITDETLGCVAMELINQDIEIAELKKAAAKLFMVGRLT